MGKKHNLDYPCFIVAEVAQAHDGSLGVLHSYIDALSKTGVDAVKFQMHIAEVESSVYEKFRVKFSYEDKTRYDYWKRTSFSLDQWQDVKEHCEEVGLEFLCSPFSNVAVDWLEKMDVKRYKIGSGDVNNFLMLAKVAETGKDIILSSGMSSFYELDEAINFLKKFNNRISILQCTSKYPTDPKDIGLNMIEEFKNRYNIEVGLSDHSGVIYPSLAAVSLGAKILEFHVVFDKNMFGPDSSSSLTMSEITQLVKGVRFIEESLKNKIDKSNADTFKSLKGIFEKSLAVNKNMKRGDMISFDDLEAKKPSGRGISAKMFSDIVGSELKNDISKWSFLTEEDINE